MPTTPDGFIRRIDDLDEKLSVQGRRVQALIESAFESAFTGDEAAADSAVHADEEIDRVDVEIEQESVALLTDATRAGAQLSSDQLRLVLTIVKVNNELERIADAGVRIAEEVREFKSAAPALPDTFRVMVNSVVGIVRDVVTSFNRKDGPLARRVLANEDTVEEFKRALLRDAGERVAAGSMSVPLALSLQELGTCCEIMAGHATNIAEQVLYLTTGAIVRHMGGHWEQFSLPGAG